jgi:peptidoglycan/LPS O-acetylase OafA/YrhL
MGASIVLIYFMHIFYFENENSLLGIIQRFAFVGVDIFVALSMFGLFHSFEKNPVKDFSTYLSYIGKRLLRIYAVFLPVTFIIMLVDNWSIVTFFRRLFLIDQFAVNLYKHLWFIPGIVLFYLFAPLCYLLVKKVKNVPLLTIVVSVIVYAILFSLHNVIRPDLNIILARIPDVFIGFMLASYDENLDKNSKKMYSGTILGMFILGVAIMVYEVVVDYFNIFQGDNIIHNNLTTPGFIIILAVLFDFFGSHKVTKCINVVAAFLGAITLEIYCSHEWIWKHVSTLENKESKKHLACILIVLIFSLGLSKIAEMIRGSILKTKKV